MARKINFILRRGRLKCRQKGVALIIFAFLLGLVVTGLGIKFLSGGGFQIQQSVKSTQALAEAKAAVIGNVISGQSGTSTGQFPCSEDVTLIENVAEGQALGSCSNTVTSIGRFAWRTMGTGDLVDGNNDKLWYALSASFRAVPVNSDTIGQLSVDGAQNQAIAILFSPGAVLSSQSRPTPTSSSAPIVTAYLETENSDGDKDFITGISSTTFNDKLVTIKADDIFPVLEKRVLGEFKNYLNAYKAVWGAFPFPAVFGNPTTAIYVGNTALTGGFIPISNASPTTAWDTSTTPTPVVNWPAGNSGSNPACTFTTSNTRIRCDITISTYNSVNPPTVSISGIVNNIGLNFYDGFTNISSTTSNDVRVTTQSGTATVTLASRAVIHSLNASGNGTVSFTGTLANTGLVRIEYRRTPPLSNWVLAATNHYLLGGSAGNNWHHLIYYKVAAPFLPGGAATCGTSCLTVNAINVTPNTTLSGNHALLMSAGRRLDITNARPSPTYSVSNPAQTRPGSLLEDYFDSPNNVSGGLVFDSTNLPLTTFNDQVQIVE
jgi:hypothetical protein